MQSNAKTVAEYLKSLPQDRCEALRAIRKVIRQNLDPAFEEGMQYGMIGYFVPHRIFPDGYRCDPRQPLPFASLASQKNHISVYMMSLYTGAPEDWFRKAWTATGRKLDMGKCCVRFRKLEDCALDVIGEAVRRTTAEEYIQSYVASRPSKSKPSTATKKPSATTATSGSVGKKKAPGTSVRVSSSVKSAAKKGVTKRPVSLRTAPSKKTAGIKAVQKSTVKKSSVEKSSVEKNL